MADLTLALEDVVRRVVREELARHQPSPSQPSSTPAPLLTVKQAADRAAVSTRSIRNWLAAGDLKTYHAGAQLRVDPDELERLLRTGPGAPARDESPEALAVLRLKRQAG